MGDESRVLRSGFLAWVDAERDEHVGADLEGFGPDARAQPGLKLAWRAARGSADGCHCCLNDTPRESAPARVCRADRATVGRGEQHRQAVGSLDDAGHSGFGRDAGVGLVDRRIGAAIGSTEADDAGAVDLAQEHRHGAAGGRDPGRCAGVVGRARVRTLALDIACEIHPLDNVRVLRYLVGEMKVSEDDKNRWYRHWVETGLETVERQLAGQPQTGRFCHGDTPGLADCVLVPQIFNAKRMDCCLDHVPTVMRVFDACMAEPAFASTQPSACPDAT